MAVISGSKDITNPYGVEFLSKDIDFYKITGATGIHTAPEGASSVFHKTVRAISGEANIVVLGIPAANDLVVGLEGGYEGNGSTGAAATLKALIDTETGVSVTVAATTISGDTWS